MRTVSILATSPEYAFIITRALGKQAYQYNVRGIAVYEVEKNNVLYKITHLPGHIMDYMYPLKNLKDVPYTNLLQTEPVKAIDRDGDGSSIIEAVVPKCDLVIAATENNAEGDSVALDIARLLAKRRYNIPTKRLRCNTFSFQDIREGLYNLESIDMSAAYGYNALKKLDFMYNTVLTHQISSYISPANLVNTGHIPINTCLTPLLGIMLKREKEIRESGDRREWKVCAKIDIGRASLLPIESTQNPFKNMEVANEIKTRLKKEEKLKAIVQYVDEDFVKDNPPEPLNFPAAISECYRLFDYDPSVTIRALHTLYSKGYISYPFTIEKEYPIDFDFTVPLREWEGKMRKFTVPCEIVLSKGITRKGTSSRKSTPIYPRRPLANRHDKDEELGNVFAVILRTYLANLSEALVLKRQTVSFSLGSDSFQSVTAKLVDKGWTWIYYWDLKLPEESFDCVPGDSFDVKNITIKQVKNDVKHISSLDLYTTVYENTGIDVENIIENSIKTGLIKKSSSQFKLTDFGREIAQTFSRNAQILVNFTARHHFLKLSEDVVGQKSTFEDAMIEGTDFLKIVSKSIALREKELKSSLEECVLNRDYQVLGKCPECGKALLVRQYTHADGDVKRFVGCYGYPECTVTYPMPKEGDLEVGGFCQETSLPFVYVHNKGNKKDYAWGIGFGPCFMCNSSDCIVKVKQMKSKVIYTPDRDGRRLLL